jgi:O-acetyl-ADP-ribose deacetylase (regulator of RNase III)
MAYGLDYKNGDVLTAKTDAIAHQVNCRGVMGAGLAKQIREKYPQVFTEYHEYIKHIYESVLKDEHAVAYKLLGSISKTKIFQQDGFSQYIVNLFAQDDHDSSKRQIDYDAFWNCLHNLRTWALRENIFSIAFPFGIGCGLAGGNWDIIKLMIGEVFNKNIGINVEIWKYPR